VFTLLCGFKVGALWSKLLTVAQVSIVALREGQIEVVQSSMLGSILSNLLLVMGMCFFLGGIFNMRDENGEGREQSFATITAQTTCSLMTLASASMIIPSTVGILGCLRCTEPCVPGMDHR